MKTQKEQVKYYKSQEKDCNDEVACSSLRVTRYFKVFFQTFSSKLYFTVCFQVYCMFQEGGCDDEVAFSSLTSY